MTEDTVQLLSLSERLLKSRIGIEGRNALHVTLQNDKVCVLIVAKPQKIYSDLSERHMRRRETAILEVVQWLKISPENLLDYSTSVGF